ncbi:ABC1 kinase family protein [Alkalimarinus sediminis]|uniref:AarF/ABC1/UbiB kinase family protein n=1 Tax=Alkalimarinus sediminis TaxID=1632866 RepID=A0A9E8HJG0_9ALTE|nr:AarF/ABC1/UbiB kinase family protein [Alkalimarinus sediminis]UZW73803.1 AarF/ABC1/UbiB kinase family protein [Alkalimarinus sediminis]
MADDKNNDTVARIKTGSFERRLSLTKAGLFASTRMAGHVAANVFTSKDKRLERRKKMLSRQAEFLVDELGKLKGSVVKIGQVMALYGEHFLPVEVTEALHTLEDQTTALEWPSIEKVLRFELGNGALDELEIEKTPIGAASLGQVHRARRKSDGKEICLKIQYPGVADAVDSDLDAVAQLLKLAKLVSFSRDFDEWLEEVRVMMHREVDYTLEAETTRRFGKMLQGDERFIVPEILLEYSTPHVMATSYEPGLSVSSEEVLSLPQSRRNKLAESALELFLKEMFIWKEIQTDPNFGNYRIRLADEKHAEDRIVLLDFGAVQKYPDAFIDPVCDMIYASYTRDLKRVIEGGIKLNFMHDDWPEKVLEEFGGVCMAVLEPLADRKVEVPDYALNDKGEYRWKQSDLPTRVAKRAAVSAINRYFKIPPKEFVFLNRKLVGVYTFISVLEAEFNGRDLLKPYLKRFERL